MFWQNWFTKIPHLFNQLVFVLWTALLTYQNGPYYTLLELCRNFQIFGIRKLEYNREFSQSLENKICVITGGTRGIGLEVVRFIFSQGCTIITGTSSLGRNASSEAVSKYQDKMLMQILKDDKLIDLDSRKEMLKRLIVLPIDLSSMKSVVNFSQEIHKITNKIDYLICNGGVMFVPFKLTNENFEYHMSINYFSHCLLIFKLLPLLTNTKQLNGVAQKSRIIVVSSGAHHASFGLRFHDLQSTQFYSIYHAYAQSKLALIMFTYYFNQWLQLTKLDNKDLKDFVTINCLHPGICRTGLMERFAFFKLKFIQETPLFRSANEGAETILYTTLSDKIDGISGKYLENCSPTRSSKISYDFQAQKQLWTKTWQDLKPWLTSEELNLLSPKNVD